jgi:aconitate hydratase
MGDVVPAISGPKRPQDYIALTEAATAFHAYIKGQRSAATSPRSPRCAGKAKAVRPNPPGDPRQCRASPRGYVMTEDGHYQMHDGSIVIASITSCTNTSNPYVMIGAGLVARKARELGLTASPGSRPRSRPGSQVVSAYLEAAELQDDLDAIGFNLVGYGCTTCIGNSGPLEPEIFQGDQRQRPDRVSVLSGNRNFEGGSAPTCAPTTSPRRRWWWPTRWWAT